jgi:hypothetical protein
MFQATSAHHPEGIIVPIIPQDVLIQLFPPDDERLSLETCRGRKINALKEVKKVRQVGCKSRIASGCTVNKI